MIKSKKMTKASGITIPKDVRAALGIFPGQSLDLRVNGDQLEIRKHTPSCHFCGSIMDVLRHDGHDLCVACLQDFILKANEKGLLR